MRDSASLIANLETSNGDICTICFLDTGVSMQSFPTDISGYFYTQVEAAHGEGTRGHPRYKKAVKRGYGMAKSFEQLIGSAGNKKTKVTVSPEGLVGGSPMECQAWATKRIGFFTKTKFDFSSSLTSSDIVSSTQFLHFSEIPSQAALQSFLNISGPRNVTILSGICLSSLKTMITTTRDERTVNLQDLEYNRATLYELEYIARSAPAIADLAIASTPAVERASYNHGKEVYQLSQICLDVPSFHYYQYVDELLRSGLCGFDEALRWLRAIGKHHEQISHVFRGYLKDELLRRDQSAKAYLISVTPGGEPILSNMCRSLENLTHPSVKEALNMLSVNEPTWAKFMQFVPAEEMPGDFQSLGYLFYVYQVVRHTFGNGLEHELTQPGLLISVDDSSERGVYSRAQKLLKRIRESRASVSPVLLEIYLCRRVFIDNNIDGSELYFHDSYSGSVYEKYNEGNGFPSSSSSNSSLGIYSSTSEGDIVLASNSRVYELDTFDVIEKLYSKRSAILLRKLCSEIGLCIGRSRMV